MNQAVEQTTRNGQIKKISIQIFQCQPKENNRIALRTILSAKNQNLAWNHCCDIKFLCVMVLLTHRQPFKQPHT